MTSRLDPPPVVVLGAPRSGTNMLRDLLTASPGFTTWPCDEINAIWRVGHARWPDDALPVDCATPRTVSYIRRQFVRRARHGRVVEKTCANTLRVPFVDQVVPEAVYVHILRDPLDAVPSAMLRWQGDADLGYLLAKARFVPLRDLPVQALAVARARLHRWGHRERRAGTWGPRFPGLAGLLAEAPLATLCAEQWLACVQAAQRGLAGLDPARVYQVRYEQLVEAPQEQMAQLLAWLGTGARPPRQALARVNSASVGKGRRQLSADDLARVQAVVAPLRGELGHG